jgi:hypothetical protein
VPEPVEAQIALAPSLTPPRSLTGLERPVWGIDPSTLRVSLAIIAPGIVGGEPMIGVRTQPLPQNLPNQARRFWLAYRALVPFFNQAVVEVGDPVLVLLEEPFGGGGKPGQKSARTVHPSSNRMLGVILAALGQALGLDTGIELIQPNSWKRLAMGPGRGAAKPVEYLGWAQSEAGYSGVLEDEAAAIGIATAAGVKLVTP